MSTLNPRWLCAAVVRNEDGSRKGTVSEVNGDKITVLCKGVPVIMSAKELDNVGLITKPNATSKKYID